MSVGEEGGRHEIKKIRERGGEEWGRLEKMHGKRQRERGGDERGEDEREKGRWIRK